MNLSWEEHALEDLERLYVFALDRSPETAERILRSLTRAPRQLMDHPRIGRRIPKFAPREVRKLLTGVYELHYEIREDSIVILRVWSVREDR